MSIATRHSDKIPLFAFSPPLPPLSPSAPHSVVRRRFVAAARFLKFAAPLSILVSAVIVQAADPPEQQHIDTPFWQDEAVRYVSEVNLADYELRTIRADRDGRVLVNTNKGLLMPFDGRLVRYAESQALEKRDHLDLEILKGKFVFLTPEFLLPVHGAGVDYLANGAKKYSRVGVLGPGRYILLSPGEIALVAAGKTTSIPNKTAATEITVDAKIASAFVWSPTSIAILSADGKLANFAAPDATIRGVLPDGPDRVLLATDKGAFLSTPNSSEPFPRKLPVEDLTCIMRDGRGWLWFGSSNGAFRVEPDGKLSYYLGQRWLPNNHVLDMTEDASGDIVVLTKGGVVKLDFEKMTLARKAELFQAKLRRHHIRLGLVSDAYLSGGDYAKLRMHDSDNDGLWSSMYGAGEAFRYAVTKSDAAREDLMDTLDALERLVTITRIPGFQARSFELYGYKESDREAWRPRPEKDFDWKGTTSSDELVGTMFFYSVLYDTCGKDDPDLKARIAKIVSSIVSHILDNDYYYIDVDGKPTRWGFWNPRNINTPTALHDRRLNSIEMLGFLGLAYELTKDEKFKRSFDELVDKHGYAENTIRHLPDPYGPWNHSDDELYWLSYYFLLGHPVRESLMPKYIQSAQDQFEANKRKRNPVWNVIYGARTHRPIDLAGVIFWLQEFPMDRRTWPVQNSHRKDIKIVRRSFIRPEADPVLPPDERRIHKWNSNEMDLDDGGNGNAAESGAEYLLPYWMGRFYGYISEPKP